MCVWKWAPAVTAVATGDIGSNDAAVGISSLTSGSINAAVGI